MLVNTCLLVGEVDSLFYGDVFCRLDQILEVSHISLDRAHALYRVHRLHYLLGLVAQIYLTRVPTVIFPDQIFKGFVRFKVALYIDIV